MAIAVSVLGYLFTLHPLVSGAAEYKQQNALVKQLVSSLQLTDLCLFTEASYTRHLSQADLHAPFQDHPAAFEHFLSGSLVLPPAHLRETAHEMD
jgi:hypothetical protein